MSASCDGKTLHDLKFELAACPLPRWSLGSSQTPKHEGAVSPTNLEESGAATNDEKVAPSISRVGHWEGPSTRPQSSTSLPYSRPDPRAGAHSSHPYQGKVGLYDARQPNGGKKKWKQYFLQAEGQMSRISGSFCLNWKHGLF